MYNLKEMFPTLRVSFEPSVEIRGDPCMMEIVCRKGIIYLHSESHLALECKTYTAKEILSKVKNIRTHQQGDSEWTLLFLIEDFGKIAEVVKPRKKRILTDLQKTQAIERLKKWQYK